jgi:glutamate synthase (ferredoxin)
VGRNVAAGMTGGLAYILDEDDTLIPKVYTRILFTNGREIFYFHYA